MTSRTINRSLIIHEDLALGAGQVIQTRGEATLSEQKIELDFVFRDPNEIRFLDVLRYTRASLHTDGALVHYYYNPASAAIDDGNSVLAPEPEIPVGRWLRVTSSSGGNLNYATVAELIADTAIIETIAPDTQVGVSGYHEAGDFGGGAFYWDELSTDTHDGGMILTPEGRIDPGRWHRIISTRLSVHHFGAVGDGVTNDRAAIEAAFTAGATYRLTVEIRDLLYDVAGLDLTITDSIRIVGTGWPILLNGTQLTFTCNSINIINLGIVDWSGGFNLEPVGEAKYNFEQFNAVRCAYGMRSLGVMYTVATLRVRGGYFEGPTLRHAYYFEGNVEVADLENVKIEGIGNTSDNNPTIGIGLGYLTEQCKAVIIRNCEIDGLTANTNIVCNAINIKGEKIILTNNIIQNIIGSGTGKEAINVVASHCNITGNSITNGGVGAAWVACKYTGASNDLIVANNILEGEAGKAGTGIHITGTGTITGNRIFGPALDAGITVIGEGYVSQYSQFTITDNYIKCPVATVGISVKDITESVISDNHITTGGSCIEGQTPSTLYDIYNTVIANNFMEGLYGISFVNGKHLMMNGNIFASNVLDFEGSYKNGWWFIDGVMSATSADFLLISSDVNTMVYKRLGTEIWDETLAKPLYAVGQYAADVWVDSAGTTVHTPV